MLDIKLDVRCIFCKRERHCMDNEREGKCFWTKESWNFVTGCFFTVAILFSIMSNWVKNGAKKGIGFHDVLILKWDGLISCVSNIFLISTDFFQKNLKDFINAMMITKAWSERSNDAVLNILTLQIKPVMKGLWYWL